MNDSDCIFCDIVDRKIPAKIIYENDKVLAFLDIFPIFEGHTILIPKNHYHNIEDIKESDLMELIKVVKILAVHIHKKLNIEGYNILQNNFKAAGQEINHFHIHIIPRIENDDRFKLKIPRNQASDEELEGVLKILKI
ncbi:MAG: HIT family protein [Promethearchaeota archaeon]